MRTAQDALKEAGFPTNICVVDFETFFAKGYSLSGMGTYEYIMHPLFEVQCCGFSDGRKGDVRLAPALPSLFSNLQITDVTWSFHNAAFDCAILAKRYGIWPKFIIDTKLLAAHLWPASSHSLKDVAAQLGLPAKGDTQNFLGLRYATMTPAQRQAYIDYTTRDVELQYGVGLKLLPLIDNPAIELPLMQKTLEMWTKPVARFDYKKAAEITKGMERDQKLCLVDAECSQTQVSGTRSFEKLMVEALTAAGDNPTNYFKQGKKDEILAIAKDDAERTLLVKHKNERVRNLINARIAIKSWPLHHKRVSRMKSLADASEGLLPIPLNYSGTTTGRWSGGGRINLQNLPKRGHPLLVAMRGLIAAQPGYKIVAVDLSTVEARVLAWYAGQQDLIQAYERGVDVYCEFGSEFFHSALYKPAEDEIPAVAELLTKRRDFSKIVILGCGFNMGVERFADYADCDMATAERAVYSYRDRYPAITGLWKELGEAFYYAPVTGSKLSILANKAERRIKLPSGRHLLYPELRGTVKDMAVKWNDKLTSRVYGGFLTENVVQATARDLLGEAMLRIEARGYRVFHLIHDEVLMMVAEDKAKEAAAVAVEELSRRPVWALDLPLAAESRIGDSYAKDKR